MARENVAKNHLLRKVIGYGVLTATLYAAVFLNSTTILKLCAKGGIYAAFPIAIAFVFSFAHGAFANYLWQFLGIEALKQPKVEAEKVAEVAKRPEVRRRPRIQA
ncbi:MAG: hypothetical protein WHS38_04160 [Thermodesulforhabdaceae bacterium]